MIYRKLLTPLLLLFGLLLTQCSSSGSEEDPTVSETILSVDASDFNFGYEGGEQSLSITCSSGWSITVPSGAWCSPILQTGKGNVITRLVASANTDSKSRELQLTLSAVGATSITLTIKQAGKEIAIAPDASGMASNAMTLMKKIGVGWNLGNTLEVPASSGGEGGWGNPKASKALIDLVKSSGFTAVRIPCAWDGYIENRDNYQLRTDWMNRVKEVVDYVVDNDMYAIINIHWDGGWLENNCTPDKQAANNAQQAALWQQIALCFRNYDEHLLFAGCNEPNVKTAEQMTVLKSYEQTFIDVVRATGGRNAYRNLIVQGPNTDINTTQQLMTMPQDPTIKDRLIMEVHYYDPWGFCGQDKDETWGDQFYFWGTANAVNEQIDGKLRNSTWGDEAYLKEQFAKMKTQFVDKGIPVILGEYGAMHRTLADKYQSSHEQSRIDYMQAVTREAKNHGIIPFVWDDGGSMQLFDRNKLSITYPSLVQSIVKAGTNQ